MDSSSYCVQASDLMSSSNDNAYYLGSFTIMTENQSNSRRERTDYETSPDLLSDLPLSIIHAILKRVPIEDAIRASVLSRQWRYRAHNKPLQVHSSIYSCEKLTTLFLHDCDFDPPASTFKGFLFLRYLHLSGACTSFNGIESLVANTPLHEILELSWLESRISELRISSPNLKYLHIFCYCIELHVSAPLLVELVICLIFSDGDLIAKYQQQKGSLCNYANFMGGFTNLEKLMANNMFTKYLSVGIEFCHRTLVFHHLKHVELISVDFKDVQVMSVVARLIVGAPNLRKLQIRTSFHKEDDRSEAPHPISGYFGFAPICTFEKLRVIVMYLYCHPDEMDFTKFLLQRSPVLETMSVFVPEGVTNEKKQKAAAEFFGFSRASPNAKLSFIL